MGTSVCVIDKLLLPTIIKLTKTNSNIYSVSYKQKALTPERCIHALIRGLVSDMMPVSRTPISVVLRLRGDKARSSSPLIVSRDSFSPWTETRFQTGGA